MRNFVTPRKPVTWRRVALAILVLLSMPTVLAMVAAFTR